MTPRKQIEVSKQTREMLVKLFKTTSVDILNKLTPIKLLKMPPL